MMYTIIYAWMGYFLDDYLASLVYQLSAIPEDRRRQVVKEWDKNELLTVDPLTRQYELKQDAIYILHGHLFLKGTWRGTSFMRSKEMIVT